ncbi:RraA family protein [Blastococcus saxobsidens]|uniref:Putative 4-hydroxy-4-methyl-2-oxoglutarate aldolase n=1 Tax=Blastococcus saxobsidens TaxID=138336 RepID=A0A4Q7Y5F1_9ACTN|nr:RraA family protein [Blastococcus saxobsidens]RZU32207.1 regulator of RNase E activity RraA [Blastococcus saxobsidens]
MTTPAVHPAETIEAFRGITTASVSDALQELGVHGYMSSQIRLRTGQKLVGPAVTVREVPTSERVPPQHALDVIDNSAPGSVVVIDIGEETEVAVWGGLMTAGAVANDLAGAVLDGGMRDVEEIRRDFGFTVFSRSVSTATTVGRYKTVAANEPVRCGGVTVNPGDLIVGDGDGVVAVPHALVAQVLEGATSIEEREREQTRLILESGSLAAGLAKYNRI